MTRETFYRLKELYSGTIDKKEINYIDGKGQKEEIIIPKSAKNSELIGIILGDGYLQSKSQVREKRTLSSHRLVITLNKNELKLRQRVIELLNNIGKEPKIHHLKSSEAIQIVVYSIELVDKLVELGLETGNKVKNQVGVPKWLKNNEEYSRACLRGLIDTDGTIYRQNIDGRLIIQFKNHSLQLIQDFKTMCSLLDIETSSGGKKVIQVARQPEVKKAIKKIKPIKSEDISF